MRILRKIILIVNLICIVVILNGCSNFETGPQNRINELTNINIPTFAKVVFNDKEQDHFFPVPGRRSQYTVFLFEEAPITFLSENSFHEERNESFEQEFDLILKSHIEAEHFVVPNEYQPDWKDEILWLKIKPKIYLIYSLNSNLLIVFIAAT